MVETGFRITATVPALITVTLPVFGKPTATVIVIVLVAASLLMHW
jgi:hypothetical protein